MRTRGVSWGVPTRGPSRLFTKGVEPRRRITEVTVTPVNGPLNVNLVGVGLGVTRAGSRSD